MDDHTSPLGYRNRSTYERALRRFEWPMLALSVVFLVVLLLQELASPPDGVDQVLVVVERGIWAAFALELVVLLWTAPDKAKALRDHWLDAVIVAAPFLRPLRVGRLLRVVRATSILGRAGQAVRAVVSRRGFGSFIVAAMVTICSLGLLTWAFERQASDPLIASPLDGVWWAVVTSTTVGYGDLYPVSGEGRIIAGALMIVGVAMLSVVTASVAAYFVERDTEEELAAQLARVESKLDVLTAFLATDSDHR